MGKGVCTGSTIIGDVKFFTFIECSQHAFNF